VVSQEKRKLNTKTKSIRTLLYMALWFNVTGCQVPTKDTLSLPSSAGQGRKKYSESLVGRDKDREKSLTNYCHRQNRLSLGKLV